MRYLLLVLIMLVSPLGAEEVSFEDFSLMARHLQTAMSESEDYRVNASAGDLMTRISEVNRIRYGERLFIIDLRWVADVGEAMAGERAVGRRRLLFGNLIDTLSGLQSEFVAGYAEKAVSRQEMKDALDRAIARTSEIRMSGDAQLGPGMEWCGRAGVVSDNSGEAISIISMASTEGSGSGGNVSNTGNTVSVSVGHPGGSSFSGSVSVSNSGQSGASSNSGSSQKGSNFSNAGSSVVQKSPQSSHSVSQHSSTVSGVSQPNSKPPVSVPSAAESRPVDSRPSPPSYSRPAPPSPPAKKTEPLRPPPRPEVKTPGGGAGVLFWVMTVIGIIGFVLIIFLIIKNMRKKIVQEQSQILKEEKMLPPERMRAETIYEKALREAEQGRYVEAIRLLTIGSLIMLESHRVINYQDSLTNGEYLRKLMVERDLHTLFAAPMALFDRLVYGYQTPSRKDFETFKAFYLDLEKLQR